MAADRAAGAEPDAGGRAESRELVAVAVVLTDDDEAAASIAADVVAAAKASDSAQRVAVVSEVVAACRRFTKPSSGRGRQQAGPRLYDGEPSQAANPRAAAVPTSPTPAGGEEARPASDPIWDAIGDLPFDARAVVALHWCAGLDDQQIVRVMRGRVLLPRRVLRRSLADIAATVGADPERVATLVPAVLSRRTGARGGRRGPGRSATPQATTAERRRPRAVIAGAVAVGLLAGAGAIAYVAAEPPPDPASAKTAPADSGPPPLAAPGGGRRLVGYGTVMLAVPRTWGYNRTSCGRPVADTVVYPDGDADVSCGAIRGDRRGRATARWSSVTFTAAPSNALVLVRPSIEQETLADGRRVFASLPSRIDGNWQRVVVVPESGVQVVLRSPRRKPLRELLDGLRSVPPGYTVVPVCERQPIRDAIGAVKRAGLRVAFTQASTLTQRYREPPVTHQSPAAGRIVPLRSVVGLGFPSTDE